MGDSFRAGDKARGALLGAALGDALGATPAIGHPAVPARRVPAPRAEQRGSSRLVYTGGTALARSLAEHLAQRRAGVLDDNQLARELAATYAREPTRGYGATTRTVLGMIGAGVPWRVASHSVFGGAGSYGPGAAARVTPIALVATSVDHAGELARRSAAITHAHVDAQHGAALQAAAVYLALRTDPATAFDPHPFLTTLRERAVGPRWRGALDVLARARPWLAGRDRAIALLGGGAAAVEAVPTALAAFLAHPDDPEAAIRWALLADGDPAADTAAAASMAGAIAAARAGARQLPTGWSRRLESAPVLVRLADGLTPQHQRC